jgi:hypothetical protein
MRERGLRLILASVLLFLNCCMVQTLLLFYGGEIGLNGPGHGRSGGGIVLELAQGGLLAGKFLDSFQQEAKMTRNEKETVLSLQRTRARHEHFSSFE